MSWCRLCSELVKGDLWSLYHRFYQPCTHGDTDSLIVDYKVAPSNESKAMALALIFFIFPSPRVTATKHLLTLHGAQISPRATRIQSRRHWERSKMWSRLRLQLLWYIWIADQSLSLRKFVHPCALATTHLFGLTAFSLLSIVMEGCESHHVEENQQDILRHYTLLPPHEFALPPREGPGADSQAPSNS